MTKSKLIQEFELASDDLGLAIVAPYDVTMANGQTVRADVLLKNFGGRLGMLVFSTGAAVAPHGDALFDEGYGISVLHEPEEVKYDRDSFVRMLSDWSWTGPPNERPAWIKL